MPLVLIGLKRGQETEKYSFRINLSMHTHLSVLISLPFLICSLACIMLMTVANAAEDPFASETLRAGFYAKSFPDFSVEDVEVSVKLLSEEIGKEAGVKTIVKVYEDIQSMRQDFENGIINFVVTSSILMVSQFDKNLLSDGFRFIRSAESQNRLLVLGQNKPNKDGFDSYRGQRLVLAQSDPTCELYLDLLSWSDFKQSYSNSFKLIKREKKAHQLILMLFFNQADVTCVFQNAYDIAIEMNPQLKQKITVLSEIENMPEGMGLFHTNTPVAFRESVIAQALKLQNKPRGRQLLELFKGEQAIRAAVKDLAAALELYNAHRRLQGRQ
jgi:ABC-type phosphate/phosphonate transport system substrate-binding protein